MKKPEPKPHPKPHPHPEPHCGRPPKDNFFLFLLNFFLSLYHSFWFWMKPPRNKNVGDGNRRVAFISVFNTDCGIATYNKELLNELEQLIDFKVFAEYADAAKSTRLPDDPDFVVRCWGRKEHPKTKLMQLVTAYNPDLIHISHEYGLFDKGYYFTSLVSYFKSQGFTVLTTMHSVYDHSDKTITENSSDHIVAHTETAKTSMVKRGISADKINVIPHGVDCHPEGELLPSLYNTWGSEHTIFHPGFLFYYKGHLKVLEAVKHLKDKYPDIHYIIQGSENPNTMWEHDKLYAEIIDKVAELGLEGHVTINRGFVEKDVLLSHIRSCKLCVLPYTPHKDHDVYATSGIARVVLSTTTPLIVSDAHLFDDLEGIVPRPKNVYELIDEIDKVFSDPSAKTKQLEVRSSFLKKVHWGAIATQLSDLYDRILKK